jgi:hypothetical protein
MAYLSVFEKSYRGGLSSQWVQIQEQKALLQLPLFLCKTQWYLLIPQEFQRNKVFYIYDGRVAADPLYSTEDNRPGYEKIKVMNLT